MFRIALQINQESLTTAAAGTISDEYEIEGDLDAQILAACDMIAEAQVAQFHLTCCSEQPWPVAVWLDLGILLQQVNPLLDALKANEEFRLEFFDQGIESVLVFSPLGRQVRINCESFWGGQCRFGGQQELVGIESVSRALKDITDGFIECCKYVCPQLLEQPELAAWRHDVRYRVEQAPGY